MGVTVVFVTGRPIRWMEPLWHHVGDHGLAICSNGGIVYDVPGRSVVEARTIPRHVGLEVADLVRTAIPGSMFALEKTTGFGKEPTFLPAARGRREPGPRPSARSRRSSTTTVVKLLALHLEMAPDEYWAHVEQAGRRRWSPPPGPRWAPLVEMSGAGVTKASTLELICAERGIAAEDVVAFGDMPNDIAMLEWAGTSYAMANGHPTAIAAADHTAPRNDEDGVAPGARGAVPLVTPTVATTAWRCRGPRSATAGRSSRRRGRRRREDDVRGRARRGASSDGRDVVRASIDGFHHRCRRVRKGARREAVWRRHFDYAGSAQELIEPWRGRSAGDVPAGGPRRRLRPCQLDLPPVLGRRRRACWSSTGCSASDRARRLLGACLTSVDVAVRGQRGRRPRGTGSSTTSTTPDQRIRRQPSSDHPRAGSWLAVHCG